MWFTGRRISCGSTRTWAEVDRYRLVDRDYPMGLVGMAAGAGSLWVASKEAGEVLRVDPANGHVQARIAMKSPLSLAYAAGAVWAVSDQGGLARIDAPPTASPRPRRCPSRSSGSLPAAASPGRRTRPRAPSTRSTRRARSWRRTGRATPRAAPGRHRLGCQLRRRHPVGIDAASGAVRTYRLVTRSAERRRRRPVLLYIGEGLTVEDRISALRGRSRSLVIPIFTLEPTDRRPRLWSRSRPRSSAPSPPDCLPMWPEAACGPSWPRRCRRSRRTADLHVPSEARPSLLASVERTHHG